jgi:hypothetical protein
MFPSVSGARLSTHWHIAGIDLLQRTNRRVNRFTAWQYWTLACKTPSGDNCSENPPASALKGGHGFGASLLARNK